MTYIQDSYNKAIKVIESCTNMHHVTASRRYVNLFFKRYSSPDIESNKIEIRTAEKYIGKAYSRLHRKLDKIENNLN
tara:strand:- start:571 stop:801 length:231 start_codon:yes stop_codon:yes gene_type:complete